MAVKKNVLGSEYAEAIKVPCERDPLIKRQCSQMRALLEDYAISRGHSFSKLLVIHICDQQSEIRPELKRHVLEVYPLSDKSKPSYLSKIKRIINAIVNQHEIGPSEISRTLLDREIPAYMEPVLALLTRQKHFPGGRNFDEEKRLEVPYSYDGECLLLAMLNIHDSHEVATLYTLFVERHKELHKELKKISRRRFNVHRQYIGRIRKILGLPGSHQQIKKVPIDCMLEPLRTEIQTYLTLVSSFADSKSPEQQLQEDYFIEKAAHFDITLDKNRTSSIKAAIRVFENFYGKIYPLIQERGMTSVSIKDFLFIQFESRVIGDNEVLCPYNYFVSAFRQLERENVTRYKRRGFDSQTFRQLIGKLKNIAIFNGYFSLIKDFSQAYSRTNLDIWLIEHRKEVKKRIYSIDYLDEQIKRLRPEFERIIKKKTFIICPERAVEARKDFNRCIFYVVVVLIRYLSYRQQCIRHCIFGQNIIFSKDGSVTLTWSKDEVKNKTPIRITLTPERYDGLWEPVIHALTLYKKTIYSYALNHCRKKNRLATIEGQFFLHLNPQGDFVKFKENGASRFTGWFEECATHFFVLPDEALDLDMEVNPHHLRGICMDWLFSLGMTEHELSLVTGDDVRTIRKKYLSKNAVQDATRVLAATDRRIKEERLADAGYPSLTQQKEANYQRELAQKEQENAEMRRRLENFEQVLTDAMDHLISGQAIRDGDSFINQQQLDLSRQLLEELRFNTAKVIQKNLLAQPMPDPTYGLEEFREAYQVKLLLPKWFDTSGMRFEVASDGGRENFYNEGEVNLISRLVSQLEKGSSCDSILIISPHKKQSAELTRRFKKAQKVRVYDPEGPLVKVADIVIISFVTWNLQAEDLYLYNFCNLYQGLQRAWRKVYLFGDYKEACDHVRSLPQEHRVSIFEYFATLFQPNSYFERNLIPAKALEQHKDNLIPRF